MARRATWLSGLLPFGRAAEVLGEVGQVAISAASVWRLTKRWGEELQEREAAQQEEAKAIPTLRPEAEECLPARLGAGLDGVMLHIRQEGWKEMKVGCLFEVEPHSVADPVTGEEVVLGHAVRNSYVGHLGGPEGFGEKVWAEAQRRRWSHVPETQVLGDGAAWIWNLVAEHFYDSEQVVDWYHAMAHLAEVSRLAYGEGTIAARRWYKKQETALYQGDAARVAQRIATLATRRGVAGEELRKEAAYFAHNKRRMNYLELRAAGYVIGSGMVESGGKQFKARLSGPGMQWSRAGAERLIPLRSAILSDRFDARWRAVYNSPPN